MTIFQHPAQVKRACPLFQSGFGRTTLAAGAERAADNRMPEEAKAVKGGQRKGQLARADQDFFDDRA
jgi:hypothetical protein